jgi:hypothetical protein
MSVSQVSVEQMSEEKMFVDQMNVGKMFLDEMIWNHHPSILLKAFSTQHLF